MTTSTAPTIRTDRLTYHKEDLTFSGFASDFQMIGFPRTINVESQRTGDIRIFSLQRIVHNEEGEVTRAEYGCGTYGLRLWND